MCSNTLGPAIAPSLLTWPMMRTGISSPLAVFINREVHSRTWATLPGEDESSLKFMV